MQSMANLTLFFVEFGTVYLNFATPGKYTECPKILVKRNTNRFPEFLHHLIASLYLTYSFQIGSKLKELFAILTQFKEPTFSKI